MISWIPLTLTLIYLKPYQGTIFDDVGDVAKSSLTLTSKSTVVLDDFITVTVTVTVTVILFKCPKNKRPRGLPLDIRLSRLHLELPYMQNVLAHGTWGRSGIPDKISQYFGKTDFTPPA